jgi:hypothetical protein
MQIFVQNPCSSSPSPPPFPPQLPFLTATHEDGKDTFTMQPTDSRNNGLIRTRISEKKDDNSEVLQLISCFFYLKGLSEAQYALQQETGVKMDSNRAPLNSLRRKLFDVLKPCLSKG